MPEEPKICGVGVCLQLRVASLGCPTSLPWRPWGCMDHSAQRVQAVKQLFCDGFPTQPTWEATNILLRIIPKVAKPSTAMCLTTFPVLRLVAVLRAASMGTSKQEFRYHEIYKHYFLHTLLLLTSKLSQQNPENDRKEIGLE